MAAIAKSRSKAKKPPMPVPRKNVPVNAEYEKRAKAMIRYAMTQRGVEIEELAERLNDMGIKLSAGGLANKISRGGFSSIFLLQCMDALDINLATLPK